ncbi:PHP domain-containing protein [Haloimpatiens sp. FM7330]|uniref:PHP domain-containing protein n=1 Tax=Haloimpatiens sp. FM7330 TaxID=3298610 RepID=UPI0036258258
MYTKGDFHLHTNASDGGYSPEDLIELVSKEGFDIMSITDHDTLDSVERGIKYGTKLGIKVIPGIELSTMYKGETIHILGYFRDDNYKSKDFNNFLIGMGEYRIYRGKKIIENLKKYFHIEVSYEKVVESAKGVIARPHIAKAIIDKGYNYTWKYIFDNILGKDSPAYIPNKKIDVSEGIQMLKDLNAVVVLAHPVLIKNSSIDEMMQFDFDGIEAIYPLNSKEDEKKFLDTAKKYNKFITAGSDFHGLGKNDTTHGKPGDICLEGKRLCAFLSALNL